MLELSLSLQRCVWSTLGIVVLHGFAASATSAHPTSRISELPPSPSAARASFPGSEFLNLQAIVQPRFGEQGVPIQAMPPAIPNSDFDK